MQKICFMLVDEQNRKFFVSTKNKKVIQEFVTNSDLQIYLVKTNKNNIKTIDEIVVLFCDQSYKDSNLEYMIIQKPKKTNNEINKSKASAIREKIEKRFVEKGKTSFAEIQEIFKKEKLSTSSLCNHFAQVRKHLSIQGVCVTKIKNGTYVIEPKI